MGQEKLLNKSEIQLHLGQDRNIIYYPLLKTDFIQIEIFLAEHKFIKYSSGPGQRIFYHSYPGYMTTQPYSLCVSVRIECLNESEIN